MLGVPIEKTSHMLGDNMSVILNTTIPSSMLKKKHQGCAYHRVRETIAANIATFSYIPSEENFADVLTKPLSISGHHKLVKPWLFRRAEVIDKAAEDDLAKQDVNPKDEQVQVNRIITVCMEEQEDLDSEDQKD